jgi:ferrous iron transport protein B
MSIAVQPESIITAEQTYLVAVAGNPNCGKTTIFNALTGLRHKVANYTGVTVEKRDGVMLAAPSVRLLDLPGTYSLVAHSPDEQVARDVLLGQVEDTPRPDAVLIVIDASNLERNLYLATQVLELGLPTVVACNMMDMLNQAGHKLDTHKLSQQLGVPVVPTVGARGEGLRELQQAIEAVCHRPASPSKRQWRASEPVEREIRTVTQAISQLHTLENAGAEGLAVLAFSDDDLGSMGATGEVGAAIRAARERIFSETGIDVARELIVARYAWLTPLVQACLSRSTQSGLSATDRLDRVLTHRFWGLLIFAPMMGLLFYSIFVLATPAMDLIDTIFTHLRGWVTSWMGAGVLRDLFTDGVIAGVGNVLVFFPQICILFLFIALLEDTGYMARAAFLMNRIMSRVGLHGKSFIPLLSSHACAVPGIMAARTIENPRDRLVTILVAPLMGCSARMPVYTLLIAACLPGAAWVKAVALLSMYGLGVLSALVMATLFKRTLLRGPAPAFVIELPPYHWPQWGNVFSMMWDRSKLFLTQAGTIILAMTIVLWAMMNYPRNRERMAYFDTQRSAIQAAGGEQTDAQMEAIEQQEAAEQLAYSAVGRLGRWIEPAIRPLGYDWKIGVGIVASLAAREVFVSTMGVVYSVGEADEESKPLREQLHEARWPDGRPVFTPLVAVGLMIFYVLACQCTSTLAIVKRETASWRWPLFMFAYMSVLAYVAALLVYQVGSALRIGVG